MDKKELLPHCISLVLEGLIIERIFYFFDGAPTFSGVKNKYLKCDMFLHPEKSSDSLDPELMESCL